MPKDQTQEIAIEDFFELCQKGGTYQIETPDGWQNIGSLVRKNNKECYNLVLKNGLQLSCSFDHYVQTSTLKAIKNEENPVWKKAEDLDVNSDFILTNTDSIVEKIPVAGFPISVEFHIPAEAYGWQRIDSIKRVGIKDTFDLEVKSSSHSYYSNNIVSHNTGKSMACDALASAYQMPLLRLDFGAVFSAHVGESEQNIRLCLQTAEAIAPCILGNSEINIKFPALSGEIKHLSIDDLWDLSIEDLWYEANIASSEHPACRYIASNNGDQITFVPPLQILGYDHITESSKWIDLYALVKRKVSRRLRISTDEETIEVSEDHQFLVDENGIKSWKKAKDLQKNDSIINVSSSNIQAAIAEDNTNNDKEKVQMRKKVFS